MAEENGQVKKNILTVAGLKRLQDELNDLKVNKRKEISLKIGEAREQGDLSENAEYDAAKDEQRDIEARIEEIEGILKHAEVVDEDEADTTKVNIGCKVLIHDLDYDEDIEFKIVGSGYTLITEELEIILRGPENILSKLSSRYIGVTASLEDIEGSGEFRVQAEIEIPAAYKGLIYELGTYYINIDKK